jgi:hypothetical protein
VEDFHTPLSPKDRSSRQKLNKETLKLNDSIDLMELRDSYRVLLSAKKQYTFFSALHGTFSKMDHILSHRQVLTNTRKLK